MKKMICLLIIAVLFISGCSSSGYQLLNKDGNYYILLDSQTESGSDMELFARPTITFSSFKEMRSDILTGNFTNAELQQLSLFQKDDSGAVRICNIDKLYEPTYPSDFDTLSIKWHGYYYNYELFGNSFPNGLNMDLIPEKRYTINEDPIAYYSNNLTNGASITSVTKTSDRNATIIEYTTPDNRPIQVVWYRIETDSKTILVYETYDPSKATDSLLHVELYGAQAGQYFEFFYLNPPERPSLEWLSQFGIREYVETSTS